MFVDKDWLEDQLGSGKSLEQIARSQGCHASTIGYWAKKHGLQSSRASKYRQKGPPDREVLEALARRGATLSEIAAALDRSIATVRHWLRKWEIRRPDARLVKRDPRNAPRVMQRRCATHGLTNFILEGRGYYRCKQCRLERVVAWRRRVKQKLVIEAGGRCVLCGYDRCLAALQFHHVDPREKAFAVSRQGVTRSFAEARAEAAKCALLCANCHAEVEAGYTELRGLKAA